MVSGTFNNSFTKHSRSLDEINKCNHFKISSPNIKRQWLNLFIFSCNAPSPQNTSHVCLLMPDFQEVLMQSKYLAHVIWLPVKKSAVWISKGHLLIKHIIPSKLLVNWPEVKKMARLHTSLPWKEIFYIFHFRNLIVYMKLTNLQTDLIITWN